MRTIFLELVLSRCVGSAGRRYLAYAGDAKYLMRILGIYKWCKQNAGKQVRIGNFVLYLLLR